MENNKDIIIEDNNNNNKHEWSQEEIRDFEDSMEKNKYFKDIREILTTNGIDSAGVLHGNVDVNGNLLNFFTPKELELIVSTMPPKFKGNTTTEKMDSAYDILKHDVNIIKKYTFDSDVPKSIREFYKAVKENSKELLYASGIQAAFNDFGARGYIGFMKDEIKQFYVNEIQNEYHSFIPGTNIKLHDIYKEAVPSEEFWKNVAVISARTSEAYRIIQSKIGETLNQWKNIKIKSNRIVRNMNTNTQLFTLIDNNKYDFKNITDVKSRDGKKLFDYNTPNNDEYMNKDSDTNLVKSFKRYYFIVLTEGYFKKGELASKLTDKIKNKFLNGGRKTLGSVGIGNYN